jgi:hypothetical protein
VKNCALKVLNIGIGVVIISVFIMLMPRVFSATHPKQEPRATVSTPTVSTQEFNAHTVAKIRQALLDYYHVAEFPDILYQDPQNLLGYLVDITPANPDVADGEFSLRFSNSWNTTSQARANQVARSTVRIIGPKVDEVNAIWARFDTHAGKVYYNERAGREVLDNAGT